jgi:hypothetical protein
MPRRSPHALLLLIELGQVSSNSTGLIADGAKVWSPLCLEGSPDAGATVAGHHGQPDHELNDADQPLEDDIPRGAIHSQQPDEGRERSQEYGRHPPWPAGWKAERLVIDLRGRCQNDGQAGQHHEEEAEHQRLRPVDHRPARLAGITNSPADNQ